LREPKVRDYTCGLAVTIVGLGLYSYRVRELMASLILFSVAFFFLALVVLGAILVWCASKQVAIWTPPLSRKVIAFSRRLITAYARSSVSTSRAFAEKVNPACAIRFRRTRRWLLQFRRPMNLGYAIRPAWGLKMEIPADIAPARAPQRSWEERRGA
jgi:hypothetical protein